MFKEIDESENIPEYKLIIPFEEDKLIKKNKNNCIYLYNNSSFKLNLSLEFIEYEYSNKYDKYNKLKLSEEQKSK
jgi:hypothetical protein